MTGGGGMNLFILYVSTCVVLITVVLAVWAILKLLKFVYETLRPSTNSGKQHQEWEQNQSKYQQNHQGYSQSYQYEHRNRFKDEKAAGDHGESLVRSELLSLLYGESLFSYIQTNNMVVNHRNFEIDFVLLVDQVGLVLVEVKYYSGKVKCTDDEYWQQINGMGSEVKQRNASKQVLRARSLLRQLMMQRNLNRWPIHAVVLFAHENATILRGLPPKRPQTEILKLKGLPGWIECQTKNLAVKFTKEDHEEIKQALKSFEREYEKTA